MLTPFLKKHLPAVRGTTAHDPNMSSSVHTSIAVDNSSFSSHSGFLPCLLIEHIKKLHLLAIQRSRNKLIVPVIDKLEREEIGAFIQKTEKDLIALPDV